MIYSSRNGLRGLAEGETEWESMLGLVKVMARVKGVRWTEKKKNE